MTSAPSQRKTKIKLCIEHIFIDSGEPISIREVFAQTTKKYPKTAYSTVFRVVQRLTASNAIHTVDWRERGSRYEWAGMPHHHHMTCQLCGMVIDLDDDDVNYDDQKIRIKTGFIIKHHSIELEGICRACQK